ncbi:TspO/MBR family protein [Bacillaceae bacterium IKA-2]|nr:TspO/MBR family protein [Bacillaceae bacterium IKA-2]
MTRNIINLFALIFVIIINYLSNSLPFNQQTTSEIANRLEVLFTPSGYVFSIWGLIYFLLAVWVFRGFSKNRRDLPIYAVATPLFVLSCLLNSFWLFLWHYQYFLLSVVIMVSLLITLIYLYKVVKKSASSFGDIVPFSVYLGWVSVATIANISYVLVEIDWNRFGLSDVFWTVTLLLIATGLAILFRLRENDAVFPLVFVWAIAFFGKNKRIFIAYVT